MLSTLQEHLGETLSTGHYISYGREADDWWKFNDDLVTKMPRIQNEEKVL